MSKLDTCTKKSHKYCLKGQTLYNFRATVSRWIELEKRIILVLIFSFSLYFFTSVKEYHITVLRFSRLGSALNLLNIIFNFLNIYQDKSSQEKTSRL